jgi:metal-sulfur cluster biosynthetic enzyme
MSDARQVREALRQVIDPEVGLDVVTMGLIYRIEVEGGSVHIRHTLTTPGCPMEGVLKRGIAEAARSVTGVEEVETEVVWEPPWHPGMIHDDAWDED